MDIAQINEWLTKTTYGTVILGAAGSALFAMVYWFFNKYLKIWLSMCYRKLDAYFSDELHDIIISTDTNKIVSYFAYQLAVLITSVAILSIVYLPILEFSSKLNSTESVFFFGILVMLFYFVVVPFMKIWIIYSEKMKQ